MANEFTRRDVLSTFTNALPFAAAGMTFGAASAALAVPAIGGGGEKSNILFIPIDDMNDWTGWLGGYPLASTPNLDTLAGKGAAMTRAYSSLPVCQGARAAIMFGIEPWRSGIYTNRCLQWPVRRQNIWRKQRRKLAECGPRLGIDARRRAYGAASADVRWSGA